MKDLYLRRTFIMVKLALLGIVMYIAARILEIVEAWTDEAEKAGAIKK